MKKYDKYKNSGIEWIGEIPEHWEIKKLKRLSKVKRGASPRPIDDPKYFDDNGEFSWVRIADVSASERYLQNTIQTLSTLGASLSVKRLPGDLFLSIAGTVGKPIITKIKCCIHDGFVYFPELDMNPEYLYYIFSSGQVYKGLGKWGTQLNLNTDTVGSISIPIPTTSDIEIIISFLDEKTGEIDEAIALKNQLIALLQEEKSALINEAVTKGIDPTVPMKDSGIEWIGDIPAHWEIVNIQDVTKKNRYSFTGGPFGSDLKSEEYTKSGVRIIQLQNIGIGEFLDDYAIYTTEKKADELYSCNIFPNDIIIAKMADPVARACMMPSNDSRYLMASDGIRLEVNTNKYNSIFLVYAINSLYFNSQAEQVSTGTTRLRIGLSTLKKLKLLSPNIDEQIQIAQYIDKKTQEIDQEIDYTKEEIALLKEYRQSLISEAVTGKIDVRK